MFKTEEILKATSGKIISGNANISIKGISTDTRTIKPGEIFLVLSGKNFDGHNFIKAALMKGACGVMVEKNPKFKLPDRFLLIKVKSTLDALGAIANLHRKRFNIKIIAITGSNGKTTAKDMAAHLLSRKYKVLKTEGTKNNQIGVPQTLLKLNKSFDVAVLELGTNRYGEIEALSKIVMPDIGIITNIALSHIKCLKNLAGVYREKISLCKGLKKKGCLIFNADDKYLRNIKKLKRINKKLPFTINEKSKFKASRIKKEKSSLSFLLNGKIRLKINSLAEHNIYNALAVVASVRELGVSYKEIKLILNEFRFPQGRVSSTNLKKVSIVDDTYISNPLSLKSSIDLLCQYNGRRKILVCADMLELGVQSRTLHSAIGKKIANSNIDILFTLGNLSKEIHRAAKKRSRGYEQINHCRSHSDVVDKLVKILKSNDVILVKGSRSMKMEKVIEGLKQKLKKNKAR